MIKILIADDHPLVRTGIRRILSSTPDLVVTAEAVDGQDVLDKVRAQDFDVVILDIAMPGQSGLEVLPELTAELPDLPVLVISSYSEDQYATHVLELGAAGYMTKECAPAELVPAVKKLAKGGLYFSPRVSRVLASTGGQEAGPAPHKTLSSRELEVMLLLAKGKSQETIAGVLALNATTVSTHRASILRKLRLKTEADLVGYAMHHGIID